MTVKENSAEENVSDRKTKNKRQKVDGGECSNSSSQVYDHESSLAKLLEETDIPSTSAEQPDNSEQIDFLASIAQHFQ